MLTLLCTGGSYHPFSILRIAEMIDTMIVLDDVGTGLSNGFIRYGWEPPTYPMYGFLCWQIIPADDNQENKLSVRQE